MIKRWYEGSKGWLRRHAKRVLIVTGAVIVITTVIFQFLYPSNRLVPFTAIENVQLNGWSKMDAIEALDTAYQQQAVSIYFKSATIAYATPSLADLGITAHNQSRVESLNYPWYLRIVPSSILWAHFFTPVSPLPTYSRDDTALTHYIDEHFGDSCKVDPMNATLKVSGTTLKVVDGSPGGTCQLNQVTQQLQSIQPTLLSAKMIVDGTETQPSVTSADAQQLATKIMTGIGQGVAVKVGDDQTIISPSDLLSWIEFSVTDGTLDYNFDEGKAGTYLDQQFADKVKVSAGTTVVSTYDFVETSRQTGPSGEILDEVGTLASIKNYINDHSQTATVATQASAPAVTYTRSYSSSDTGLAALMQNFASSHSGTYGVSLIELSGSYRHASYNGDTQFTTASTYKLFVAYSSLLRVESGAWQWSDQIEGGYDLSTCFDRMIELSDNACAEALLTKVGYTAITNDAHAIGCTNTSFLGSDGIKSTAADEALLLSELQTKQILSNQSDRDKWINAMENNVYRQGIPAGLAGVTVADKVGFLDALLHDAAIVYSPSGTYVLVILTNNSSWANIADLASQLQALRVQ